MNYTISKNAAYNSLEISFDGKPSEAVRDALKALRFRWHSVKKVWYGYTSEEAARAAIDGKAPEKKVKNAAKPTARSPTRSPRLVSLHGSAKHSRSRAAISASISSVTFFISVGIYQ